MGWNWFGKQNKGDPEAQSNNQVQPQHQTHSYFQSYSRSRVCKQDPEDQNFLICKEKVNDGNSSYENQERVPVNNGNYQRQTSQGNCMQGFPRHQALGELQGSMRQQFDEFEKEFENFMTPLFAIPAFFNMAQTPGFFQDSQHFRQERVNVDRERPQGHQNRQKQSNQGQNNHSNSKNFYFSNSGNKDYNIKDI